MEIKKIVVAGAGTMGASMAQIFARYGYEVTLYNHRQKTLDKATGKISDNVKTLVETKALTDAEAESLRAALSYTVDLNCFQDCDLVVENLTEVLAVKEAFYTQISELVRPDTVVATNTSGLSINKLGASVKDPSRFLGMHWFNPPHLVPLIEIIKGDTTTDEAAQTIYDLSLSVGKKPVIVQKDVPGFAGNRLQFAVLREALDMVEKGIISPEGIDDVMKYGLGFRYACLGPLEVADFGGLDTFYHISEYLMKDLCDSKEPPALLKEHFENQEFGVKNEKGFYDYSDGKAAEATQKRDEAFLKLFHALYD